VAFSLRKALMKTLEGHKDSGFAINGKFPDELALRHEYQEMLLREFELPKGIFIT